MEHSLLDALDHESKKMPPNNLTSSSLVAYCNKHVWPPDGESFEQLYIQSSCQPASLCAFLMYLHVLQDKNKEEALPSSTKYTHLEDILQAFTAHKADISDGMRRRV
jgi:hypothetical protein